MLEFIAKNYEWLFSGIGVTFIVWLISHAKKIVGEIRDRRIMDKLLSRKNDLPPKYLTTVDENGNEERSEVILAFAFKDTKREYVVYTKGETDKYGNITVYVSEVDRCGGKPKLLGVPNEKEWSRVRDVLKELAESEEDQPIYDEYGIEII